MFRETHARSISKALSWRLVGTLLTVAIVFVFTRSVSVSLAVGGVEFLTKTFFYWLHERAWDRLRFGKAEAGTAVLWLTGLSGAGKSTLADWLTRELRSRGVRVEQLDGDAIRSMFPGVGFLRADRDAHVRRVGHLASTLERHGVFVVASLVSPYAAARDDVRRLCRRFLEVHVSTPIEECERRDVKGLYGKARRGEIQHFTGIDDPYEPPVNPELRIDTSGLSVDEAGERVLAMLGDRRILDPQQYPVSAERMASAESR